MEFSELLAAVSNASGIEFAGEVAGGCETVSIRFDFLVQENALSQLLRGRSYILSERHDGALIVWLLPGGDAERLTEIDPALETFYSTLTGSPGAGTGKANQAPGSGNPMNRPADAMSSDPAVIHTQE